MRWRWIFAGVPIFLGATISLLLNSTGQAPLYRFTVDLGTIFFVLGLLLSVFMIIIFAYKASREKAYLEAVQKSHQDRRRFLRRLDHELKNPLTAILAGLANIASADTSDVYQIPLESINSQAQRLRRLVSDLRKLSDLETRKIEREPVDMAALLSELFALIETAPGADSRQLVLSIPRAPWPLPTVSGDWDLIFLAVYNLLDNAVKFTQPADTIELRASEDERVVVIEIADTGYGIPTEEIPCVWDELFRGEGAQSVPGSGLGLSLVRAIAIRHGGNVTIRSRPQQGTVVTMRLPVNDEGKPSLD
jgi:two-component system, OmpR family, sensor kinase